MTLLLSTVLAHAQQVEFKPFAIPTEGRIVVPCTENEAPTGIALDIDQRVNGALRTAMLEADFECEAQSSLTLYAVSPYARIDLIGLGDKPTDRNHAENAGGLAAKLLADTRQGSIRVLWKLGNSDESATAARFAFGYLLRSYRFDRYQEDKIDPAELPALEMLTNDGSGRSFSTDLAHLAEGVFFARNMSSEPANLMYPQAFVDHVRAKFKNMKVKLHVLDEKDLQAEKMGAHWGVGKGSARPPRLLIIEYMGK